MLAGSHKKNSSNLFTLCLLVLALVGAASMLYYYFGYFIPRAAEVRAARELDGGYSFGNDLYQIWLTSRECAGGHCDPYSPKMTLAIQTGLYGRPLDSHRPGDPIDRRAFPYPVFTDLLFWPVSQLPFAVARMLFVGVLVVLAAGTVLVWLEALGWHPSGVVQVLLVLLVVCSYPALEGLYAAQVGLLVAFLLAVSIRALQSHRMLLCGVLLAFSTIKPQVGGLLIFYLLVWSLHDWPMRKRICIGLSVVLVLLVGAGLMVWPHWVWHWVHAVSEYQGYTPAPLLGELLAPILGPRAVAQLSWVMPPVLLAWAGAMAWRNRAATASSLRFCWALSLVLAVTTVALLPGQAIYDHLALLPGGLLLAMHWRQWSGTWVRRTLMGIGFAVLLWPYFASFAMIVLRPLLSPPVFYSKAVFVLPLRTALVFPFVVLGLLALAFRQSPYGHRVAGWTFPDPHPAPGDVFADEPSSRANPREGPIRTT